MVAGLKVVKVTFPCMIHFTVGCGLEGSTTLAAGGGGREGGGSTPAAGGYSEGGAAISETTANPDCSVLP